MNKLHSSVGRGGRNISSDVVLVQTLLNRHIVPPAKLLVVDGVAGLKTVSAILVLQHRLDLENCDGRVDPSGMTFHALLSAPKSVQVTQGIPFSFDHAFTTFASVTHGIFARLGSIEQSKPSSPSKTPKNIPPPVLRPVGGDAIAWGAKVSPEFKRRVIEICKELEISPDYLMSCMAFETCETFKADIENRDSHAIGLIQFTSAVFKDLETSKASLARMTNVEQLEYVRTYFIPYKGKIKTLEDVYMVILCPAAVGKGSSGVVYKEGGRHPKYYVQNKNLDQNADKIITVEECSHVLRAKYRKGLSKGFIG